ncbi:MAG: L-threonylcarbamoyladenylate synthase [Anaerovoracaceae bacterium]|jgi:L-threonylcarbamoyladenylate synthase
MITRVFEITQIDDKAKEELREAAKALRNGGLVAFPTETVYGLGADALNPEAVRSIYLAKGRPSDNPIIVHIADLSALESLVPAISPEVKILAERFWPGPLTMVLPKLPQVPHVTTGGLPTVAVRMPDNPIALELIRQCGCPIAAPSANISGRPSPTKGDHVVQDLMGKADIIIKSHDCKVGIESTVLDLTGPVPTILRPGILTPEQLGQALGKEVIIDPGVMAQSTIDPRPDSGSSMAAQIDDNGNVSGNSNTNSNNSISNNGNNNNLNTPPKSPGMKYTHYAPKAEMVILRGARADVEREMEKIREEKERAGRKVGVLLFEEKDFEKAAHDFFAILRDLDDRNVDLILAGALNDKDSIGLAVMNRMLKAAGYKVIDV